MAWWAGGCLQTAECDQAVPCEGEQICFDFRCATPCRSDDECSGETTACVSCQISWGGLDNQCHGDTRRACVEEVYRQ